MGSGSRMPPFKENVAITVASVSEVPLEELTVPHLIGKSVVEIVKVNSFPMSTKLRLSDNTILEFIGGLEVSPPDARAIISNPITRCDLVDNHLQIYLSDGEFFSFKFESAQIILFGGTS